ncbi:MAG: hypothetical protein HQ518_25745 [Rhodopirellula sp.]|nr:hypothetical protein [Rhodopirellula sp.]
MKSIIHKLTLATLFAVVGSVGAVAQEESAVEPAPSPPPAETPAPLVEQPTPAVESPLPVVESVPQPVVESPAPQAVNTTPTSASEPVKTSRPGRPAESTPAEGTQQGGRPSQGNSARGNSVSEAERAENRKTSSPDRGTPGQNGGGQSGRAGGRGPDRPLSGGPAQQDYGRRNNGQRSQLGISIGPGGVQVFQGNPGIGPGSSYPARNYYGWGRGTGPGYSPSWYQNRGWGIAIGTRPQVIVPTGPTVVTQPQSIQPTAPQPSEEPPVPTDDELAGMPGVELRGLLLFAIDRLDQQLDGLSTGSGWKSFLKTDELRRTVPPPMLAPPPPEPGESSPVDAEPLIPAAVRRQLADILQTYERVQQNPDYRQISQIWGFQTTHVVLRELLIPPVQRLRRQLAISAELLEQELQQFETNAQWAKHLRLADAKRIAEIRTEDISPADLKQLDGIVSILDSVATKPSYRMISDLLGFHLTQYASRSYLAQLKVLAPPAPLAKP